MSLVLSAKPVVQKMKESIKQEVAEIQARGVKPTLGIIRVGARPDDVYYEKSIIKNCDSLEIATKVYPLDLDISMQDFLEVLQTANNDRTIDAIMIFRPLPEQLDENVIKHLINPEKDIDCMNPVNLARIFEGDTSGLVPCTPAAVIEILKYYGFDLQGANVAVVGRSMVVGKPLSMMLLKENATVTICHSKTKDIPDITRKADIVVAAIGKAKFINQKYIGDKSIVIDVGINDAGNGSICGDVDFEEIKDRVRAITPVPGGIGTVTTAILLRNVVSACIKQALR